MSSNLGYESEKTLEDNLIKQLCADGYEFVEINDIDDLHLNGAGYRILVYTLRVFYVSRDE